MIPDDELTVQPPDSLEIIDDEAVIEKTIKTKTTTFAASNNNPQSNKNVATHNQNKNKENHPTTDVTTLKSPILTEANNTMTQRTIEVATAAVIVNNRITTPVTLQLRPFKGSTNLNVLKAHKNIFSAMKLIDPTLKIITFQNETIDTTDQFPSSASEYTSTFKEIHKDNKSSRVYISHKIESAITLGEIKYGNKQQISSIFETLVKNNAYLSINKFSTHKEHSIGFFTHINPKVTLRDNFRNVIQDELMWVDLDDEECAPLIHQIKDSSGKTTGQQKIVIPAYDLYGKEIGDGNGNDRVTTYAYEIRTSPTNANMLKNILCKISNDGKSNLRFIPYGIHSLSKEGTMKNIILQHNMFLKNMAIVPIINIKDNDKDNIRKLFESSLYFSGFEATRKASEGMYLLITNKSVINKAQKEADNLLLKFCASRQSNSNQPLPERKKRPLIHNQMSSYIATLSRNISQTPPNAMLYSPPSYKRPVSITFTPDPISKNKPWAIPPPPFYPPSQSSPPPSQKQKVHNDTSTINTATTTDSTNYQLTTSSWKDELDDLKQASNVTMKQLITENNITMTTNLNESMNENLKEFQSTFMKTVEGMIAKQMSVINLNMIQTIKNTLMTSPQDTTQENQRPNNISQSLTQLSTSANTSSNTTTNIENQSTTESTPITPNGKAKRKQNDQLCPEDTQDNIPDEDNDIVMEGQNSIINNQRNQTILSPPNRRELRKKSSSDSQKTLSRLGKTRK